MFQSSYSLLKGRARDGGRLIILDLHSPAEQLHPSPSRSLGYQFARFERLEHSFDLLKIGEIVHPLRPPPQFADGLRTAQHQHAQQRHFPPAKVQRLSQPVAELFHAMAHAANAYYKMFILK